MRVVDRAAAPASRNMDIRGYGSRLALRLAGTTEWFDAIFKQLTRHMSAISRRDAPQLKHERCRSKKAQERAVMCYGFQQQETPGRMPHEAARFHHSGDWHSGGGVADFVTRGEISITADHADRSVLSRRSHRRAGPHPRPAD